MKEHSSATAFASPAFLSARKLQKLQKGDREDLEMKYDGFCLPEPALGVLALF